ncbi:hypothetical protein [Polyangium spumosum]|uniref:Uncharacterized protein n=1 Tax=Polyangium spumosum TaxID=889282 RepID=A0A6N7PX56_9BACT|nr:hypothetical protein [Polyangium spumosum]MRG94825.1 hypothetical protein [Polyangium spumosum]
MLKVVLIGCATCAIFRAVNRKASPTNLHARLFVLPLLLLVLTACKGSVECTTEITAGTGTFKGSARGQGDEKGPVMKAALRDACQKMCVDTKAPVIDACVTRCTVDVGAAKIGARTSCND